MVNPTIVSFGTRIINPFYLVEYVIVSQGKGKNEDLITESIHIKCNRTPPDISMQKYFHKYDHVNIIVEYCKVLRVLAVMCVLSI